jgi:hypothetical protein
LCRINAKFSSDLGTQSQGKRKEKKRKEKKFVSATNKRQEKNGMFIEEVIKNYNVRDPSVGEHLSPLVPYSAKTSLFS